MLHIIPLSAVPNQNLHFAIGGQSINLTLNTRNENQLFATISVNNELVVANRLCLNGSPLISVDYLPIIGNLVFIDKEGSDDPIYSGLGSRFVLLYSEK